MVTVVLELLVASDICSWYLVAPLTVFHRADNAHSPVLLSRMFPGIAGPVGVVSSSVVAVEVLDHVPVPE